ncbi:MAG TPA: ABC transporter permease [Thermoanaerobaculia bacterium]|nr:ABC transporter permease [Thermoanaerobaculia bacterium]
MRDVRPPLVELTIARMKEFLREPEAIFWVFAFPILLTVALGFAFREKPPDRIPVGVVDGPHAKARAAALSKSPALQVRVFSLEQGRDELRRGKISLLVEEAGGGRDVRPPGDATPVYRYDATRPDARTARVEVDDALQAAAGRRDVLTAREERVTEVGARYVDFLVPGLLGMNIMGTGMWSIGFSVVNARLKKLLKRLIATPMRKSHYLAAHLLMRTSILAIEVAVLVALAWFIFDVRISGSVILFALICLLGGLAFAGLGLLVASRAKTLEAVSGLMNLVMVPMWICSGVFFSYERFPDAAKPFIRALPLTALNDALRGVMNDGLGAMELAPQLLNLVAWGVVSYLIGLKIFRWQ